MSHMTLNNLAPTAISTQSHPREGVDIQFSESGLEVSEQWSMGGWLLQFIRLPANETLVLDASAGRIFIKVIYGSLANIPRGSFAKPREVRSTLVACDHVMAGERDTLFAAFTETPSAPVNVTDMTKLTMVGPNADAFRWRSFQDRFGDFISGFDGAEAYMSGGFHLLDSNGIEITYVNLWTAGKGVNLTTHNHDNEPHPLGPTFAETHWVFNNGTGRGGMYGADSPDGAKTDVYPMQRGDEHGPFFFIDNETRKPMLRKNGSVNYPWHGWEGGVDDKPGQAYDVVAAFETNPQYVEI